MNRNKELQRIESPAEIEQLSKSHHDRNCKICQHPECDAIEEAFLHWHSGSFIAREFGIPWRSIYRHAHAKDLFNRRRRNVRNSLEFLIEKSSTIKPSGEAIVRAVQLYTRINDDGELVETPKTQVIVISRDGKTPIIPDVPGLKFDRSVEIGEPAPLPVIDATPGPDLERVFHFQDLPVQLDNANQTEFDVNS